MPRKTHEPQPLAEVVSLPERVRERLAPEPEYECLECLDRGMAVTRRHPDGTVEAFGVCRCRKPENNPRLVRARLASSGLRSKNVRAAYDPWDTTWEEEPTWALDWLAWSVRRGLDACPESLRSQDRPDGPASSWCLALFGQTGVGKSMTSARVARRYIESGGEDLMWIWVPNLYRAVMRERQQDGYSATEGRIDAAGLVIFDDYGNVSERRALEEDDWFGTRLSARELDDLPTVLSSNADGPDAFEPRIGSRIASGYYRLLTGPDRRDV